MKLTELTNRQLKALVKQIYDPPRWIAINNIVVYYYKEYEMSGAPNQIKSGPLSNSPGQAVQTGPPPLLLNIRPHLNDLRDQITVLEESLQFVTRPTGSVPPNEQADAPPASQHNEEVRWVIGELKVLAERVADLRGRIDF